MSRDPKQNGNNGHKNGNGKPKAERDLTTKEELFWQFYLGKAKFNGTEAARLAGFSGNDNALGVRAFELLRKRKIKERVDAAIQQAGVKVEEVIGNLVEEMRSNITDVYDDDGKFDIKLIRERNLGHLIKSITPGKFGIRVEIYSRQAAEIQLCKILGIEKQPATNPADDRLKVEQAIQLWMEDTKGSREEAIHYLAPFLPEVKELGQIG